MLGQQLITEQQFNAAKLAPLPSADEVQLPGTVGPARYFTEYVKQQLIDYYGSGKVFGGGLKVYTSIDLGLQTLASEAINKWLTWPDGPQAALVAIDPRSGKILAMVSGEGFSKSQFNLATQGERQPGSSFKPFVLATALSQGISPQNTFESKPVVIDFGGKLWSVTNYENSYLGSANLVTATTVSDNTIFAQLTALVGPKNVASMAHRLGVTSPLNDYISIGLGNEAVNPLEMARAYSTFADDGARVDGSLLGDHPRAILAVNDGKHLDVNAPLKRQVLSPSSDSILTSILEQVVSQGTGRRAALADRPAAGKTGTTDNYGDAWFVGYTPQLAVAVWVGYPDRLQPMLHEFGGDPVAGGTYPALIWHTFMKTALAHLGAAPEYFPAPSYPYQATYRIAFRNDRWLLDNGLCRDTRTLIYFAGQEPPKAPCKRNEVDVPVVVGAKSLDAEARLAKQPLQAEIIYRPANPGERPGVVVAQYPKTGTLSAFATVRLVVARATTGVIPKVIGLTLSQAELKLADEKLESDVKAFVQGKPGVVIAQVPAAGVAAAPSQTVTLTVGR